MLFQRINRTDPEKIFVIVKNNYATASLANGQAVIWDFTSTADADGINVTRPAAAGTAMITSIAFAGIVTQAIAYGEYGLIQCYGYHAAAKVRAATGRDVSAGEGLVVAAAGSLFCLQPAVITGEEAGMGIVALASTAFTTYNTTGTQPVFIKGM